MSELSSSAQNLRVLGVYAHPDDEVFCAGGTFAKYVAAGAEAMVVSVTRGQAGQIRSAQIATRYTLGQVREQELHLGCQRLGIQQSVCLNYGDGSLQNLDPEILICEVTAIIRSFRPDVVLTFGPDGGYGHPDHVTISTVTTAACKRAGVATQFPEQLTTGLVPHQPGQLYHSLFPRRHLSLLNRLVQWLTTSEKRFYGSADFAGALLLLAEEATLLGYTSDHIDVAWYPAGFYIIEQGEAPVNLYLILSGIVEIVHEHSSGSQEVIERKAAGEFFGEDGLVDRKPRKAHVVAIEHVTCLVFSPSAPTAFIGRGQDAHLTGGGAEADGETTIQQIRLQAPTVIDVSAYISQKVQAIAAHASQFPLKQDMLPLSILQELMGREFFVRVYPPPASAEITTDFHSAAAGAVPANDGRTEERRTLPLGRLLNEF
jgi:LmbE family N-acetylglucosaminyl deacetylase